MGEQGTHGDIARELAQWRAFVSLREGVAAEDVDELEDHLLATVEDLTGRGLAGDEAFLVAVKRLGRTDAIAREFAREHSDRLWKQLVLGDAAPDAGGLSRTGLVPMLVFAVLAGLAVRIPAGLASPGAAAGVLPGWALLGVAAVAAAYAGWVRRPVSALGAGSVSAVLVLLGLANALYPFAEPRHTQVLFLLHAAIALAVALGAVYVPTGWREPDRWLDWIRFVGEFAVYNVLLALVGGALVALALFSFEVVGLDAGRALEDWVLPLGVGGAVIVAAWRTPPRGLSTGCSGRASSSRSRSASSRWLRWPAGSASSAPAPTSWRPSG